MQEDTQSALFRGFLGFSRVTAPSTLQTKVSTSVRSLLGVVHHVDVGDEFELADAGQGTRVEAITCSTPARRRTEACRSSSASSFVGTSRTATSSASAVAESLDVEVDHVEGFTKPVLHCGGRAAPCDGPVGHGSAWLSLY